MKILYYHQYFSTPDGSTGNRSYMMARYLIEAGHEVTVICGSSIRADSGLTGAYRKGRREGVVNDIHIVQFDLQYSNHDNFLERSRKFLKFAWRSTLYALRADYDVLFATTTPLTAGIPGIVTRWLRRKPFVFEVRDLWPSLPREMGVITNPLVLATLSALEWSSYRSADRLVGLSPGIGDGIAARGVPRQRIDMIPNGCDFEIFSDTAEPWRPDGVEDSDLLAVFTGAHGIANGLDAVLDAAAELKRRQRTDIKIVLIGDGKEKPRLRKRAVEENLTNVIFHDLVGKTRLAGLLRTSNVGLQILSNVPAFYYGTSPNKFFDYIAASLPVLNNYPGWLADLIREADCGYVVAPDDPEAFADALIRAADRPDERMEKGRRARHIGESRFHRERLAEQFRLVLEGAVQGRMA